MPAAAVWLPAVVLAAVVSGTVAIPPSAAPSRLELERSAKFIHGPGATDPGFESSANATTGVVALVRVGPGVRMFEPARGRATLDQVDKTFIPALLPIVVGTTVDFPNQDEIYHNVFSYSRPKRFDLGRYASGEKRSVTFDTPGVVRVFCEIHSFMRATIVVLPTPYFAVVDDAGGFEVRGVPSGEYQLLLWHEGLADLVPVRSVSLAATDSVRVRLEP
ncbi:MAG: plastocyanin/azurin family copper-binding protein [bacterium]